MPHIIMESTLPDAVWAHVAPYVGVPGSLDQLLDLWRVDSHWSLSCSSRSINAQCRTATYGPWRRAIAHNSHTPSLLVEGAEAPKRASIVKSAEIIKVLR